MMSCLMALGVRAPRPASVRGGQYCKNLRLVWTPLGGSVVKTTQLRVLTTRYPIFKRNPRTAMALESSTTNLVDTASAVPPSTTRGDESGYKVPSKEIVEIVDSPPTPALSVSPCRKLVLLLHRPNLPSVSLLARPELKLAGLRIDPGKFCRSRMTSYTSFGICNISENGELGPEKQISQLPEGGYNFVSWSPDGKHIAFALNPDSRTDSDSSFLDLWIVELDSLRARQVFNSSAILGLNTIFDEYAWLDGLSLVAFTIPESRRQLKAPVRDSAPIGPKIQENRGGRVSQYRTYTDLLKDPHDADLFEFYATSEIVKVSIAGGKTEVLKIGDEKIYSSAYPSPDGRYLLIEYIERPFSYTFPCGRFPQKIEVWKSDGTFVKTIAKRPLADNIPIAFNSCRTGPRSINWRSDKPAELYWAETQDGGDPSIECSPRDIVYSLTEPFDEMKPKVLTQCDYRYNGIVWGRDNFAILGESFWKNRRARTWKINPEDNSQKPEILFDRSYEDSYSDPGAPLTRRNELGKYVLAFFEGSSDEKSKLIMRGEGASAQGDRPFLNLLDVNTMETVELWRCKEGAYEVPISIWNDNIEDVNLGSLKILFSMETKYTPPQFFVRDVHGRGSIQITNFPHPYPSLKNIQKEIIRYVRSDGVHLTAKLYLPPEYDAEKDDPLPLLMWAYPKEFKDKEAAGQVRGSPFRFPSIGSTSPLLFLAKGYAILDGPTFPIVGEAGQEANDTYIEQLVASAEAAVDEVVKRGIAQRGMIAIGGHSYGAFMTANLLAHAPNLFACGIAQSGAYNRTLTPFGFQAEERTLWQVPDTYVKMSPYMNAHKIKKPILLVHGEADNNSGTFPLQSERFFSALEGHGAECKLVLLPHESHGYRGRESILHVLAEREEWLGTFCRLLPDEGQKHENGGENIQNNS